MTTLRKWLKLKSYQMISGVIPTCYQLRSSIRFLILVIIGAFTLAPLIGHLPMLGWDWYLFFNHNNPNFNISSPTSVYPPFAHFLIEPLTLLDWRNSLGLLNSLTVVTLALATWQNGGRYGSILLILLTPPLWFLMWIGHPDGLCLLGLVMGFIPLALIKPQLTIFSMLSRKTLLSWTMFFLVLTLIIWPGWPLSAKSATLTHEAAFGWVVTGWPILVLGLAMLAGAGNDTYRLMAAGLLVSPYLMPYNLALLLPVIGQVQGSRKIILWTTAWLTILGVGLGWPARYLNLIFPITAYWLTQSVQDYIEHFGSLINLVRSNVLILFLKDSTA